MQELVLSVDNAIYFLCVDMFGQEAFSVTVSVLSKVNASVLF